MRKLCSCLLAVVLSLSFLVTQAAAADPYGDAAKRLAALMGDGAEEGLFISDGEWNASLGGEKGGSRIVYISRGAETGKWGVVKPASGEIAVPFIYDMLWFMPDGSLLTLRSGAYAILADGEETPVSFDAAVAGVDEEGYVTLYRSLLIRYADTEGYGALADGTVHLHALLDRNFNMVLDFVAESPWPQRIAFHEGRAAIQTGSTAWTGNFRFVTGNGAYVLIDRSGRTLTDKSYDVITYASGGRYLAVRGNAAWLLNMDGTAEPASAEKPYERSAWAEEEIAAAIEKGLVPADLQGCYTCDITRREFCVLAVTLYETLKADTAPALAFVDCGDEAVLKAAALGIVRGYEDGTFRPHQRITREEAAAMLGRLYELLYGARDTAGEAYADDDTIQTWARSAVYAMRTAGIMGGVGDNRFDPSGNYTVEQAIATMLRIYRAGA